VKHNTHIYVAAKAIEFCWSAGDNLCSSNGSRASAEQKSAFKAGAKELQRLLRYHQSAISEASWAPDDVLNDKSLFHTFKLFTAGEFSDAAAFAKETHLLNGKSYYRAAGGGGLPYKVDHLARCVVRLRAKRYGATFDFRSRKPAEARSAPAP
jgi:hypothetical protein